MALSSCSFTWTSPYLSHKLNLPHSNHLLRNVATASSNNVSCAMETTSSTERHCQRRPLLLGLGALAANLQQTNLLFAEEIPDRYRAFVDYSDGYSYVYPSDWKEFDFRAHDSAFKDRYLQLQNVRVRFIPTEKNDIRDLGPMEEVVTDLVKYRYTAPNQRPIIYDMQEGKRADQLHSAVLDEVDILFGDEDFETALQYLISSSPVDTQYLFVTATLPKNVYSKLVEVFSDCEMVIGPSMH